jgi:hypothetical protein
MNKLTIRAAAAELGVAPSVIQRLARTGLLTSPGAQIDPNHVEALKLRCPLNFRKPDLPLRVQVVSLGPPQRLTSEERIIDGSWREWIGFDTIWSSERKLDAARGWWWNPKPTPDLIVATAPGGFVVGAYSVIGVDAQTPGKLVRYAVIRAEGIEAYALTMRIKSVRGPTAKVIDFA